MKKSISLNSFLFLPRMFLCKCEFFFMDSVRCVCAGLWTYATCCVETYHRIFSNENIIYRMARYGSVTVVHMTQTQTQFIRRPTHGVVCRGRLHNVIHIFGFICVRLMWVWSNECGYMLLSHVLHYYYYLMEYCLFRKEISIKYLDTRILRVIFGLLYVSASGYVCWWRHTIQAHSHTHSQLTGSQFTQTIYTKLKRNDIYTRSNCFKHEIHFMIKQRRPHHGRTAVAYKSVVGFIIIIFLLWLLLLLLPFYLLFSVFGIQHRLAAHCSSWFASAQVSALHPGHDLWFQWIVACALCVCVCLRERARFLFLSFFVFRVHTAVLSMRCCAF